MGIGEGWLVIPVPGLWSKMLTDEGNMLDHSVVLVLSQLRSRLPFVNEMEGNYLILCVFTLKMLLILGINGLFFK